MKQRLIASALALTVLAAGAAWFLTSFERVPVKRWVGASGEARLRQFLAAERFAERMGMPAAELRSLPQLDRLEPAGVLILPRSRQALGPATVQRLLAWVANGGHVIIEAEPPEISDAVLDALRIGRQAQKQASRPTPPPSDMSNAVIVGVELEPAAKPLSVVFNRDMQIDPAGRKCVVRAADRGAAKLCSFRHGKGMVTAATSLGFARNSRIGLHDDAEFLWRLLTLTEAKQLNVFFRPERLSLWSFLRENAVPVLVAAAALLALWLWRIAPRFGPLAPEAPPARRRLLDHLRASGRYYWAQGLRGRLGEAARDAALRRLARAQPDFAAAPQAERAARLAALIGIPQEDARRFLEPIGALRGADFVRLAQHAQLVHSSLEKGNP